MKTYFVISDIHSFYDEMIKSLDNAGFDRNNKEHILIVCGDIFDRGAKPLEVYNYLRTLPRARRILIRGNHEILLKQLYERKFHLSYDIHNGTLDTLCYICGQPIHKEYLWNITQLEVDGSREDVKRMAAERNKCLYEDNQLIKDILEWIDSDEWRNYYELGQFIFVHSFIPLTQHIDWEKSKWCNCLIKESPDTYRDDWRNATQTEWEDATWYCPWKLYRDGLFDKEKERGKILVCGHWHAGDFWNHLTDKQVDIMVSNPMFKEKGFNIIALDACTVLTHTLNVLVIKEVNEGDEVRYDI